LAKNKTNGKFRNRENEILFIDARKLGRLINRRHRELEYEEITMIAETYHNWRNPGAPYQDIAGFCKTATLEEVRASGYVLMPGKYVGTEEEVSDGVLFQDKMQKLTTTLAEQFARRNVLEKKIRENLMSIGYEF
jgi:type I restriction enzyme M protein